MILCNYGCGEEAKYQLKNGKWCCSKFSCQCSSIRLKNRNKNIGRKQSKETVPRKIHAPVQECRIASVLSFS